MYNLLVTSLYTLHTVCYVCICAGNSPLHHTLHKSSCHAESTPLSSPSSLLSVGAALTVNPFAINYDSGNCDHWQSSGSTSSSGGQSPLLMNTGTSGVGRENGMSSKLVTDEARRSVANCMGYPQVGEMRNNLQIETTGLPDPNPEVPSPLSPKGLQFRHRPFLPSSSLQSPIPRSAGVSVLVGSSATPTPTRSSAPLSLSKSSSSLLQHDKYLSPFNSDLGTAHGHAHNHPHTHANSHRPLYRLRPHLSTPAVHRHQVVVKPEQALGSAVEMTKSFPGRLSVHSPLSKLAVSTSVEEYHNPAASTYLEVRRGGGRGRGREGG